MYLDRPCPLWSVGEMTLRLERWVAVVPVGLALERVAGIDQARLIEMAADKLERDRPPALGKAGGERNGGTSGHVERTGEAE